MFELGQGDNLPFSSVRTLAWVQLPRRAWLGAPDPPHSGLLGGEQGRPPPRKGMQILFKRDERKLTECGQVWALSAQPSPRPVPDTFYLLLLPPLNYWTGAEIIAGM